MIDMHTSRARILRVNNHYFNCTIFLFLNQEKLTVENRFIYVISLFFSLSISNIIVMQTTL